MLQLQQRRQGRTPTARREVASEVMLDQLPVHQPSQTNQRVLHVELLVQARAKHLSGLGRAGVRLHGLQNLQECGGRYLFPCKYRTTLQPKFRYRSMACELFRAD